MQCACTSTVQYRYFLAWAVSEGRRSQDVFERSSVQQRHTICAIGRSTATGSFTKLYVEKYDLFHKELPVLKSNSPALANWDPGILQSTFGCMVQFSNMTKAARHRVKIRGLIFFMFSVGGGSETWKKWETYGLLCTQFTSVHNSLLPAKQLKTTTCFISCHIP